MGPRQGLFRLRGAGLSGPELAPFTLAPRIGQVDAETRRQVRATAEKAGLKIIGLHWLLAKTEGFQVTSPDPAVRAGTASYLGNWRGPAPTWGAT